MMKARKERKRKGAKREDGGGGEGGGGEEKQEKEEREGDRGQEKRGGTQRCTKALKGGRCRGTKSPGANVKKGREIPSIVNKNDIKPKHKHSLSTVLTPN